MQIYFHSRLCSYFSRVPILVEGTVYIHVYVYIYIYIYKLSNVVDALQLHGGLNYSFALQHHTGQTTLLHILYI